MQSNALLMHQMSKMVVSEVEYDPRSADFCKIKFGDTRYYPMGGLQQYLVGATKLITGESKSSTSGKMDDLTDKKGLMGRDDIFTNFLTNKLAPISSFVLSWMKNREFDGTPFDVKMKES